VETGAISTASPARQSRGQRCSSSMRRKARCWRAFAVRRRSLNSQVGELAGQFGNSLRRLPRIFPFWGTRAGDEVRSPLRARACSGARPFLCVRRRQIVDAPDCAANYEFRVVMARRFNANTAGLSAAHIRYLKIKRVLPGFRRLFRRRLIAAHLVSPCFASRTLR
jgi:hypothetical protein